VELLNKNFSFRLTLILPSSGYYVTGHKGITYVDHESIKLSYERHFGSHLGNHLECGGAAVAILPTAILIVLAI
jgi:hypothetical protein